jgi:hypothetical protein
LTSTIRSRKGRVIIRVSDLLTDAPPEILRCVVTMLVSKLLGVEVDGAIRTRYRRFVNQPGFRKRLQLMRRRRSGKRLTSPKGQVFDLTHIFEQLNRSYFQNQVEIRHLSWSQKANRTTLGHFDSAHQVIIINKRLDDRMVPRYVVAYVLYHEMLHAFLGEEISVNGRRIHHRRFKSAEKQFADFARAQAFIRDHYPRLISRNCSQAPQH